MKDLTVIIPVSTLDENGKKLLEKAYKSVKNNGEDTNIIVIGPSQEIDVDNYVVNDDNIDYASQVMTAVKLVKTTYFSVVEFDDIMSDIWLKNVQKYVDEDLDDTFAFLPLTEVVDYSDNNVIGYANEPVWAASFCEEIGFYDMEALKTYLGFNVHGGVFKTHEFIALGGLKTSMKITYWYEFLLRALYKQKKIFVIPKVGYYHYINREGSITEENKKNISEKESDWWVDLANKEYFFTQDRKKTYEE